MDITGTVKQGYGVASGTAGDPRFPTGTLNLQVPIFLERGLDLRDCFSGTINLDISPYRFAIKETTYRFQEVKWSPAAPAETFSFCPCTICHAGIVVRGWIYYPHPETKPEHFHDNSTMELLAPWMEGLSYGDSLVVQIPESQIWLRASSGR